MSEISTPSEISRRTFVKDTLGKGANVLVGSALVVGGGVEAGISGGNADDELRKGQDTTDIVKDHLTGVSAGVGVLAGGEKMLKEVRGSRRKLLKVLGVTGGALSMGGGELSISRKKDK